MNDKQAWICVDAVACGTLASELGSISYDQPASCSLLWVVLVWSLRADEGCLYGAHVHLISLHNSMLIASQGR